MFYSHVPHTCNTLLHELLRTCCALTCTKQTIFYWTLLARSVARHLETYPKSRFAAAAAAAAASATSPPPFAIQLSASQVHVYFMRSYVQEEGCVNQRF